MLSLTTSSKACIMSNTRDKLERDYFAGSCCSYQIQKFSMTWGASGIGTAGELACATSCPGEPWLRQATHCQDLRCYHWQGRVWHRTGGCIHRSQGLLMIKQSKNVSSQITSIMCSILTSSIPRHLFFKTTRLYTHIRVLFTPVCANSITWIV
jgi:hypothetical protein